MSACREPSAFDHSCMAQALLEAKKAEFHGEVPVGAVLVGADETIIARAGNRSISDCNPGGHAEMVVLAMAGQKVHNYRLPDTTLYVTIEPCPMCAAALVHARVQRVVYGAPDPKGGGMVSRYRIGTDGLLNHEVQVTGPCMEQECAALLQAFFRNRREKTNRSPVL